MGEFKLMVTALEKQVLMTLAGINMNLSPENLIPGFG